MATSIVFPIVLWGNGYIDFFLEISLPSFLADGNVPSCARRLPTTIVIVTRPVDQIYLEEADIIGYTRTFCTVEIIPLLTDEIFSQHNKYGVMSVGHHFALLHYGAPGVLIGILSPDCILSANTLKAALERIDEGYSAVMLAGPRAALQPTVRKLREVSKREREYALELDPRSVVSLFSRFPHPISQSLYIDGTEFSTMPSCVYWRASGESFVAKYFHLHPLLVAIGDTRFGPQHTGTVDSSLLSDAGINLQKIYVCVDSDEMLVIELSDEGRIDIPSRKIRFKQLYMINWATRWTNNLHREFFLKYTICFRGDDRTDFTLARSRAEHALPLLRFGLHLLKTQDVYR